MPGADETAELRDLQARAYGRGGGLTHDEARRLRDLEQRRDSELRGSEPPAVDPGGSIDADGTSPPHDGGIAVGLGEPTAAAAGSSPQPSSETMVETPVDGYSEHLLTAMRRHWRAVALAAVVSVLAGLGIGWAVFGGSRGAPMALSAEQQVWQSEIVASADFDPGSVSAIAEEEGMVVWFATKDGGQQVCLIIGDAEATGPSCATREQTLDQGLYASIVKPGAAEDDPLEVNAQLQLAPDGDPAVITYSYRAQSSETMMYATAEDEEIARALVDGGLDARSLMVVGRDDGVPIWFGIEKATQRYCLVYDGSGTDSEMVCEDGTTSAADGHPLVLDRVDRKSGAQTRYEYVVGYGTQYLTITRGDGDDRRE